MGGRFLSSEDQEFVDLVYEDVRKFQDNPRGQRALLFPAVDPKRRYLIHSTVQDYFPSLTSLSVGQGDQRRTAVTFKSPSPPTTPSHPSPPDSPSPPPSSVTSNIFPIASQTFENSNTPSVHNTKHSTPASAHSTPQQRSAALQQTPSAPHSERGKTEEKKRSSDQRRHGEQTCVVEAKGLQHEEAALQERQNSTQRQQEGQRQNCEQHSTQRPQGEQHKTQKLQGELHNTHRQQQQQGKLQQQQEGQHTSQRQRSEQHNTRQGQQYRGQHITQTQHNTPRQQQGGGEQQHNYTQHSHQREGQHNTQRQQHNTHNQQGGEQQCNTQRPQQQQHNTQRHQEQQHHISSKHRQQEDKDKHKDRSGTGERSHRTQTSEREQRQQQLRKTRSRSSSFSGQSIHQPQEPRTRVRREAVSREVHQVRENTTTEDSRNYTNNKTSRRSNQEEAGNEEQQAGENNTASEYGNNGNRKNRRNRKSRRNTKDWTEPLQGGEDGVRPSEPDPGGGSGVISGNGDNNCAVRKGLNESCGTNNVREPCTVGRTNSDGTSRAGGTNSGVKSNSGTRSIGGTGSEGGRRKKLKSTGEEEETDLRGATPDVDSRLDPGRLGSPVEERWVSDSPGSSNSSSKDTQRMPVTMPPENCTANNKRRGKAAAQIYRPPPARNSREEVTPLLLHQSQKHVAVHDPHRNTLQQDAHRNSYLQDLQRNGFLQQDTHRNNYLQDLQRNGYFQEGAKNNDVHRYSYHSDLQRNNFYQDPQRYSYQDTQVQNYPENQNSGRQRTDSESSMAGDLKTGRGRRPDQVLYVPRGRRGHNNLQDPSSARATPTPLQECVDMARPPSPAMSVCSVASEFSGRNRYNRSRQGSQASVYDGDVDRVKGKPPVSKYENGRDGTQGYGKQKNSGRFAVQTLQLIERCLNQDTDQRHGEKWDTESLSYSSSPKSKLGQSSGERVQKSPTPTRDIHSIHSKENIINPVESCKRSRKRRNRRRHSRSREPSTEKQIDSVPATSCLSSRDQQYSSGQGDGEFGSSERIFYNSSYDRYDRGYDNYDRYSSINNSRASSRNSSRERAPLVQSPNYGWRSGPNTSSPAKGSVINSYSRYSSGKPPSGRLGSLPNVSLDYGDSPRKNSLEERFHTLPAQHDHKSSIWQSNIHNISNDECKNESVVLNKCSDRTANEIDQKNSEENDQGVLETVNGDIRSDGDSEENTKNHVLNKDSEDLNSISSRVGESGTSMEEESISQQFNNRNRMEESEISNQSAAESLEEGESNIDTSIMDSVHSESWSETSIPRTNGTIAEEESVCELETSVPDTEIGGTDSLPADATQLAVEHALLADNSTKTVEFEEEDRGDGEKKGSKKFSFNWADEVEDSWDSLYNDAGECLDPDIKQQLNDSIGKVKLEKPTNDYYNYQPKEPEINEEEYAHVIEIYDFPVSFKTQDLMMVFNEFQNTGFDIKWVDDTHALGIFSTALVAAEALSFNHPFIKTRSLASATKLSRSKAMRITDALLPYKPRPATSAALARRLVSGALGLKVNISREVREAERQKLKDAKARKKLVAKQRLDAWEGTLT